MSDPIDVTLLRERVDALSDVVLRLNHRLENVEKALALALKVSVPAAMGAQSVLGEMIALIKASGQDVSRKEHISNLISDALKGVEKFAKETPSS